MQKCKIEGCYNKISNKSTGLCHKHHLRFIRYGTTELTRNKVDKSKKCKVAGCERNQETNDGFCLLHYKRFRRTGKTELNKKQKCKYCDRIAIAKGLCNKHYQNYRRHGDAEYSDKKRKELNKYGYKKSYGKHAVEHREIYENEYNVELSKNDIIHHIDLDKQNNDIENLYRCNLSKHAIIHQQLNKIAGELIRGGLIKFKNGEYYICKQFAAL